jgi:hypothetical protein
VVEHLHGSDFWIQPELLRKVAQQPAHHGLRIDFLT